MSFAFKYDSNYKMKIRASETQPLVKAVIEKKKLHDKWWLALGYLIEHHEKKYKYLATRRDIGILIDRYKREYFPEETMDINIKKSIISGIQNRYFDRVKIHMGLNRFNERN